MERPGSRLLFPFSVRILCSLFHIQSPGTVSGQLIITGFRSFGRFPENSSERLVRALSTHPSAGRHVARAEVLPVEYGTSFDVLEPVLRSVEHSALICFGLADGDEFRLERLAHNRSSSEAFDNAGVQASGTIVEGAPATLASRLPLDAIALALGTQGVPFYFSEDAGGFVCNDLFFRVLHAERDLTLCGLIHVPPLERLAEEKLVAAGAAIVEAVVRTS